MWDNRLPLIPDIAFRQNLWRVPPYFRRVGRMAQPAERALTAKRANTATVVTAIFLHTSTAITALTRNLPIGPLRYISPYSLLSR